MQYSEKSARTGFFLIGIIGRDCDPLYVHALADR